MPPRKKEPANLTAIMDAMEKKYPNYMTNEKHPTYLYPLDYVLSGGYIKGGMYEFSSEPATGKTTGLLHMAKNLVKAGQRVLYLNIENAPMESLLEGMGMQNLPKDQFFMLTPTVISEIEEVVDGLLTTTAFYEEPTYNHVIFDSIGAMLPDMMKERKTSEITIGAKARQQGDFFTTYMPQLKRRFITTWFINHLSTKINTSFHGQTTKDSKGGNTFLYYMDVRLRATSGDRLYKTKKTLVKKDDREYYANIGKITTVKNKTGAPYIEAKYPVFYGKGVSNIYFIYEVLAQNGYAKALGSWIQITILNEKEPNKQGLQGALDYIKVNQKAIVKRLQEENLWF